MGLKITGDLTVDAPNATVNNHSDVGGNIIIENVSVNTWNELASTNSLVFKAKGKTLVIRGNVRGLDIQEPTNLVTQKQLRNVTIAEDVKVTVRPTVNSRQTTTITGGAPQAGVPQKPIVITPPAVPVAKVSAISVDKEATTLPVGTSETLVVTFDPTNATNKNVTWSSSDEGVATVDANGKVTAVAAGTATITVTTEDGGFTATTAVNVVPEDTVAMIDDVPYNSLQAAITAASSGHNTIKLYDNIETGGLQLNGKNVAFDLNGKTLNTAKLEVNTSTVVFGDSSENGEGTLATDGKVGVINAVNSNVTIENGRFVSNHKDGSYGYAYLIQVRNSELTINGGYFENNDNVGSYNYLIKAPSNSTITINGGEFVSHRSYGYIVSGDSDANVNVVINGGKFDTTGSYSYLTNLKGSVVVNDCTFTATGNNTVFNIPKDSIVTVKGGTFSVTGDPALAGLIYHRKTDEGWTSASGTLLVDPVNPVKVNQLTHSRFLAEGANHTSDKDADGFYTISK